MADETHCHADGAGPCLAGDCPIAGQGPLAGHLRPCPGATGPQHAETFPRFVLDRWVTEKPQPSLPDFLLARYAEEEAIAARADGSEWRAVSEQYPVGAFKGGHLVHVHAPRWRADIEAKRRIVELHGGSHECSVYDHRGDVDNGHWCIDAEDCSTMRLLALPYAGHPDYREEWKS